MPLDLQYTQFLQDSMQAGHEPVVSHNYSKITQQNGRKTTTEKRLRVTNVTGLLRACFCRDLHLILLCSGILQKDLEFVP